MAEEGRHRAGEHGTESSIGEKRNSIGPHRRRRAVAFAVGAIIIVAALSSIVILTQPEETIKIAVLLVEPGPFTHTVEIELALEMAVEDINKWGGISNTPIELLIEEVPGDSVSIAAAFSEVEQNHHPLFYLTAGCEFMAVLGPLAEESNVPLIGLGSAPGLTEGFEWVYRFYTSVSGEADSAIRLLDELNVTSLGILYSNDPHGCGISEALAEEFSSVGGTVESEGFGAEADMSQKISNLSDNQALFSVGSCGELSSMLMEIQDSGYDGYMITSSCGSTPLMYKVPLVGEVYVSAPLVYKAENIPAKEFMERFESVYGVLPTHHGAVVHDILHLAHGLIEGHEISRESLKQQLDDGFIYPGVVGIIRIDAGIHDFDLQVFPAVISEGELRYL